MLKCILITSLIFVLFVSVIRGSETEEIYIALKTLANSTEGTNQVGSYVGHFCLTTQKAIRENKRGWYTLAKADYLEMKNLLSSDDLDKFKNAFLAFESVFYKYDGN